MKRMGWWLAVSVVLAAGWAADAAVLCTKRSGAVVIRDACKRREHPLDLAQFGASGPQGTPGTAGTPGTPGATGPGVFVLDANGALVGPMIDEVNIFVAPLSGRVVRRLGNDVVSIPVDPVAGFPETPTPPPRFFANANCTGQMYVIPPPVASFAIDPTTIIHDSVAYYALSPGSTLAYASVLSFFVAPASCTGGGGTVVGADGCCSASASSTTLSPAGSFDLSTLGLVAPFHAMAP
jgi:hypothetical protein